ncbi:predicted protein [Nematostella vectensis]|uniref:EGF-like domain-containing protein n=1 Tax=Nematostella vectensis TaxID=45351 RepID=A7SAB4_NEMVE|nr:predicted protein [Nematostella vectensis]|eukprot:XP_001631432.1 predicted protein [Nematostella vectensis]
METCTGNLCQHGGTCHYLGSGNYKCACTSGFTGANCETNINECASNPCLNGGTCVDGVNKYTCSCVSGYIGTRCETGMLEFDFTCITVKSVVS